MEFWIAFSLNLSFVSEAPWDKGACSRGLGASTHRWSISHRLLRSGSKSPALLALAMGPTSSPLPDTSLGSTLAPKSLGLGQKHMRTASWRGAWRKPPQLGLAALWLKLVEWWGEALALSRFWYLSRRCNTLGQGSRPLGRRDAASTSLKCR